MHDNEVSILFYRWEESNLNADWFSMAFYLEKMQIGYFY